MRNAASFAEILDTHLGCTEVPPPPRVSNSRPQTSPLFAFELPLTAPGRAPAPAVPAPLSVEPRLPAQLTPQELQSLHDARTFDALRRAYRKLARRYHPDHHQGGTAADRQRLARLFAEATAHYRQLTRRFSPVQ